jgi:hypothetical protein
MVKNVNPFGVFLERMQQPNVGEESRTRSSAPQDVDATAAVLYALQASNVVDPSSLGLDFVELGRALDRLRSLQAIELSDQNGRQVIRRAEKFDDVCSLLKL